MLLPHDERDAHALPRTPDEPRPVCYRCFKPTVVCVCGDVADRVVDNRTEVIILQHPRERHHPIGTARLARLGLRRARVIECAPRSEESLARTRDLPPDTALLYPGPHSRDVTTLAPEERPRRLVVIDGTWHHARRIYQAAPWLGALPHLQIRPQRPGAYRIRREPRPECLSTIEAILAALRALEPETPGLDGLEAAFHRMIDRQIAFRQGRRVRRRQTPRARRLPIPAALRARYEDLVLVFGELAPTANGSSGASGSGTGPAMGAEDPAGGRGAPAAFDRLVYFAALRPATGERFEHYLRPPPPALLDAASLAPTGLDPERVRAGTSRTELAQAWARFIRPRDVLVAWNDASLRILDPQREHVSLKAVYCNLRREACGHIEDVLRRHDLVPPPRAVSGPGRRPHRERRRDAGVAAGLRGASGCANRRRLERRPVWLPSPGRPSAACVGRARGFGPRRTASTTAARTPARARLGSHLSPGSVRQTGRRSSRLRRTKRRDATVCDARGATVLRGGVHLGAGTDLAPRQGSSTLSRSHTMPSTDRSNDRAPANRGERPGLKLIREAMASIEKQFGKGAIMRLGEQNVERSVDVIPSGCVGIDLALGVGGFPRGRIIEVFGPESSGKTTLALQAIAQAHRSGGMCAFIDAEHALDVTYARALGVQPDNLLISQPDSGEQALEICETLVRSGAVDLLVLDSVAALVPKAEIEGDMGDSHMGLQARLMSQAMRKLTGVAHKTNCSLIFINQLRQKIGVVFGNPEVTTGGNALKFYASVRIEVRRLGPIKNEQETIGNRTRVKVVKNKIAPPFKQVELDVLYGRGIWAESDLLDQAVDLGIVTKSGSWMSYGDRKLGQGREKIARMLEEDRELFDTLRAAVVARATAPRGAAVIKTAPPAEAEVRGRGEATAAAPGKRVA